MINEFNIPNDKREARIYLVGMLNAYNEYLLDLSECDIELSAIAKGAILNKMEYIKELLNE